LNRSSEDKLEGSNADRKDPERERCGDAEFFDGTLVLINKVWYFCSVLS
jgi:hypothetical protein